MLVGWAPRRVGAGHMEETLFAQELPMGCHSMAWNG